MHSKEAEINKPKTKNIFGMVPNVFFCGLISFLTDISTKMIYSVMPLFLLSIGASKTQLSLIEGIAESTASVLKVFSGWWSDKIGKNKPFMAVGYFITALITPLYTTVVSPIQVLFLRFVERVGKGVRTAPRDSLIVGSANGKKTGINFGFHKAMDNAGAIIGPLLAFLILLAFTNNYKLVFLLAGIPAVLGTIVVILFIKETKRTKADLPAKIKLTDFSIDFYLFLFIAFIFTLGNSTDALLLVKAQEIGIASSLIPLVYLIFNTVSVIFAIPMGSLSDKIGREKVIIGGFLIYSVVYFIFGLSNSIPVIILMFALYGIYSAATDGIQKALVADLTDCDKMGTAMGLYNAVLGITLLPASLIAGLLYDKVNSSVPFYFGSIMAFFAAIMMIIFYLRRLRKLKKNQKCEIINDLEF